MSESAKILLDPIKSGFCLPRTKKLDTIPHFRSSHSRQSKDLTDTRAMVAFLNERTPFEVGENSLHSFATGIVAKANITIDATKIVGHKILNKMVGECVLIYSFRKRTKQQMDTKFTMKTADDDSVAIR